jgi:hypothetical protein
MTPHARAASLVATGRPDRHSRRHTSADESDCHGAFAERERRLTEEELAETRAEVNRVVSEELVRRAMGPNFYLGEGVE